MDEFHSRKIPMKMNKKQGFTLVEIMVSVAIFAIIMTIGMGSLISMTTTYRISQQEKQVHDSLNYSLESITREMRLGTYYHSESSGNLHGAGTYPFVGSSGADGESDGVGFLATDNRGYVSYYVLDGVLYRNTYAESGGVILSSDALTDSAEIEITDATFTVMGTASYADGDLNQPLVWIRLSARSAQNDEDDRLTVIQTLVSQRLLDF